MKPIFYHLLGAFLLLCCISFSQAQTYVGKQKDIDQILKNANRFSTYLVNQEYGKLVACYTKDGKIFPNRRKIMGGTDALNAYWTLPDSIKTTYHQVTPEEITISGKYAYDYGYYEGKTEYASGRKASWKGKYVIVWRKEGKDWKIYLDIWNGVDG
ncbi:MAG: nuclear transport factor 2 family protein [Bacteroidota bacterium]